MFGDNSKRGIKEPPSVIPCKNLLGLGNTITVIPITGQGWQEVITAAETVESLKRKIHQRTGIMPHYQGLIFCNDWLKNDSVFLRDVGIGNGSVLRLVVISRSGPLQFKKRTVAPPIAFITPPLQFSDVRKEECNASVQDGLDERRFEENLRMMNRMTELRRQMRQNSSKTLPVKDQVQYTFSATEDTSAKESSECDEDKAYSNNESTIIDNKKVESLSSVDTLMNKKLSHSCAQNEETDPDFVCPSNQKCLSAVRNDFSSPQNDATITRNNMLVKKAVDIGQLIDEKTVQNDAGIIQAAHNLRHRTHVTAQPKMVPISSNIIPHSEDGSEFSSEVVSYDLSSEFRRLRVRRKHHGISGSSAFQRIGTRNRTRQPLAALADHHKSSDLTSSDDDNPHRVTGQAALASNSLRRSSLMMRTQQKVVTGGCHSQQRCYSCAVKLNYPSAFHCRCGKTLCSRHRPSDMHSCLRTRKIQDVSD